MVKILTLEDSGKTERRAKLGTLSPGSLIRLAELSFEEALSGKDDATFYWVLKKQSQKDDRVSIVSIDCLQLLERDGDREVIVHPAELSIGKAEMV